METSQRLGGEGSLQKNTTAKLSSGVFISKNFLDVEKKDSRFAYRWLSEKKIQQSGGRHPKGWEVVRECSESGEKKTAKHEGLSDIRGGNLDTCERRGTLVLGRMPVEEYELRQQAKARRNRVREELLKAKSDGVSSVTARSSRGGVIQVKEDL